MITHPQDESMILFEAADLVPAGPDGDGRAGELLRLHGDELRAVVTWAREYLCRPHPELGRRGAVCPYTQASLDRGAFLMAVLPGRPAGVAELTQVIERHRDWFAELAPRERPESLHSTILVLLPGMADDLAAIDAAQAELKDEFVPHGLMIGEFHDGPPDKQGLWNAAFRPLRSPVPMLVIRHMVATDLPFLMTDAAHLSAYRRVFGDHVPAHLRELAESVVSEP
ncbi:hypothetical protein GCM10010412_044560 [Nonomuraea recticatena]|uniref:DUF6875 domain-containing protein n=1 Tax=Nonomuraea recticatena TaxID=46178 RepID=A0ABN3S3L0_9ACTN